MSNGSTIPPIETWPPPKPNAAAVDPFGLQSGSTASTAAGLLMTATGGAGAAASALGVGTSTKVAAAGFSLAVLGQGSLCAGFVLIGLGIVLNVASLVVRRQFAREYETEYVRGLTGTGEKKPEDHPPGARGE